MSKKLRKRLDWLFFNRTSPIDGDHEAFARWRYVPRGYSDDGPGWGVYDRLGGRFLSDAEVIGLPMATLQTATHLS